MLPPLVRAEGRDRAHLDNIALPVGFGAIPTEHTLLWNTAPLPQAFAVLLQWMEPRQKEVPEHETRVVSKRLGGERGPYCEIH